MISLLLTNNLSLSYFPMMKRKNWVHQAIIDHWSSRRFSNKNLPPLTTSITIITNSQRRIGKTVKRLETKWWKWHWILKAGYLRKNKMHINSIHSLQCRLFQKHKSRSLIWTGMTILKMMKLVQTPNWKPIEVTITKTRITSIIKWRLIRFSFHH